MDHDDLRDLIGSSTEAAFAVDARGRVVAWNAAAEPILGLRRGEEMPDRACWELLDGEGEHGAICSPDCPAQQAIRAGRGVAPFDIQAHGAGGPRWFSVATLVARVGADDEPCSIHVLAANDLRRRMELVCEFVERQAERSPGAVHSSPRAEAPALSERELSILRLLSTGATTPAIAASLHISRATVANHVQHVLTKLGAHSRIEAIRRAEAAGIL